MGVLNNALKINPEHADSLLLRSEIEFENHKLDLAFSDARSAIRLDNRLSGPYEVLAKISKARGNNERSILEEDRAKVLRKQRENCSLKTLQDRESNLLLLTLVNKEIEFSPSRFNGYFHRTALMQRMGNTEQAIKDADKAVFLSHSSLALKNRAILFARVGNKYGALKDLDSFRKLVGDAPDVVHTKVGCLREMKMFKEALEECSAFLRRHPKEVSIYCDRAALESNLKLFQMAISDCKRALSLNPNCVEALVYLSAAKTETRDYSGAVASATQAISINPNCSLAYNYRAAAYKGLGKLELATPDIEKAISCENSNVISLAFKNRGEISAQQGDFEQAIADFESSRDFEN